MTYQNSQQTMALRVISETAYRSVQISCLGQNRVNANSLSVPSIDCYAKILTSAARKLLGIDAFPIRNR